MSDNELSNVQKLIRELGSAVNAFEHAKRESPTDMITERIERNIEAIEKAQDILHMMSQWANAYPEDIFRPVEWSKVHEHLKDTDAPHSGSAIAGDCMRFVVTRMKEQMEALAE